MSYNIHIAAVNTNRDCGICLESITSDQTVANHKGCSWGVHLWHRECLKGWMNIYKNCPLCKMPVKASSLFSWKERIVRELNGNDIKKGTIKGSRFGLCITKLCFVPTSPLLPFVIAETLGIGTKGVWIGTAAAAVVSEVIVPGTLRAAAAGILGEVIGAGREIVGISKALADRIILGDRMMYARALAMLATMHIGIIAQRAFIKGRAEGVIPDVASLGFHLIYPSVLIAGGALGEVIEGIYSRNFK